MARSRAGEHLSKVPVESVEGLTRWFADNHRSTESVWIVTYKKSAGARHVPLGEVRDAALAHGWVDSLPRTLDAQRTMLLVSPRRSGSNWSALNKSRIDVLRTEGRMHPAGEAAVERAVADGSWTALDAVERLEVPADLAAALSDRGAGETFDGFSRSARRGILEWIQNAKRPATRAARIETTARMAAKGQRALIDRED